VAPGQDFATVRSARIGPVAEAALSRIEKHIANLHEELEGRKRWYARIVRKASGQQRRFDLDKNKRLRSIRFLIEARRQRDVLQAALEEARGGHEMAVDSVVRLRHELVEARRQRNGLPGTAGE
jgi:hypothetical protein